MNLKEEHLKLYRSAKDEIEGYEKEVQELESSTFKKMNDKFRKDKEEIFKNMTLLTTNTFLLKI